MPHIPDSRHAAHDPLLVAAYAAGDATGSERDAAAALVAGCDACADLHADLLAIAGALPALPAPVRPRDFRLTPEQAATLRPSGWRRLLAPLAGPRFAFAGPLGTGLATLGIAGILVAGSFGAPIAAGPGGGTAATGPAGTELTGPVTNEAPAASGTVLKAGEPAASGPATQLLPVAPSDPVVREDVDRSVDPDAELYATGITQAGPAESPAGDDASTLAATDGGFLPWVPLLSALALVAGLVLVGLRLAGRRLGA